MFVPSGHARIGCAKVDTNRCCAVCVRVCVCVCVCVCTYCMHPRRHIADLLRCHLLYRAPSDILLPSTSFEPFLWHVLLLPIAQTTLKMMTHEIYGRDLNSWVFELHPGATSGGERRILAPQSLRRTYMLSHPDPDPSPHPHPHKQAPPHSPMGDPMSTDGAEPYQFAAGGDPLEQGFVFRFRV